MKTDRFTLLIITMACFIAGGALQASFDPNNGLVAHYPFDGNASDMSGNGNHGTLVNGLSSAADRFSVSNRAAVFTGTQFLKTPEFGSEDITVSLWYKSNSDVSEDPAFFGNLIDSGANRHPLLLDKRDMKLGYYDSFWQVADYTMPKTTWVHLTMVASSSNWKLYVDGSLIGEKTNYFGNQNDPVKGFGNYVDTGSASPQGALDDIRIYNRALSAADVAGLYQLERPIDLTSGLVAHYPFDGNASDMSGNGNHGTLVNGLSSAADRFSVSNRAAVFTGTQFLKTPEFGSEDITVSLWYKSNSDVSEDSAFFGNLIDSGANRHPLLLDKRDMKLGYYDSFWQVADYTMPKTTWVHLTMVASSSNWKLYVDGSLIGEKTNYFGNQNDPVKGFGNYVDTGSASPQGALDDIRIYNRALSAADVAGLYQLERPKDSDFDGLFDTYETYLGTDPNVADTDGDGLNDGQEVTAGTNPKVSDKTVIDAVKVNSANFGLAPLSNLTATGATPHTNGWYYQPEWGWVWTNANVFPYVYRSPLGGKQAGWLYFREGSAPPYFHDYATGTWSKLGE